MNARNGEAGRSATTPTGLILNPNTAPSVRENTTGTTADCTGRLVMRGAFHRAIGRRRLGVVTVPCTACGHLHLHRARSVDTADGATRTGSCGVTYILAVRPALPNSAPLGGAA